MNRAAAALLALALAVPGCKGKGQKAKPQSVPDAARVGSDAGAAALGTAPVGGSSADKLDAIAQAEDARASGAVLPYLRDADAAVRARAARALGRVADDKTYESLRALLDDGDRGVRLEVAQGLAVAGDGKAGPALVRRFNLEKDPAVSRAILRAIGLTGGDEGPAVMAGALHDADAATRAEAGLALARYGVRKLALPAEVVTELAKRLGDADPGVRYAAAYGLFRAKATGPVPPAGDAGVSAAAPAVPAPIDQATGVALVNLILASGEPETSAAAVRALATRKSLSLKLLADTLGKPAIDWRVRVELARGLWERDDKQLPAAAKLLHAALKTTAYDSHDAHVAIAALEAAGAHAKLALVAVELRAIAKELAKTAADRPDAPAPVRRRLAHVRCAAAGAVARAGDFDALSHCDPGLVLGTLPRRMLADALGEGAATLHLPEVDQRMRALDILAKDKDATVRAAAAGAVGGFVDARAAAIVRERLNENDVGVVTSATEAAKTAADEGKRPDLAALERLITIATKQRAADWVEARLGAVDTLGVFPKGIASIDAALREALHDPSSEVVRHARDALAKRGLDVPFAAPHPDPAPAPQLARGAKVTATITLADGEGELHCTLDHEIAPRTVDSFVALTKKGFYDKLTWHRVVPDFVVQGGDPRGDGTGGPGFLLRAEPSLEPFVRGALGIADAGKDTGGSQFFLMHARAPHLEGRYTWFGRCDEPLAPLDDLFVGDLMQKVTVDVH